MYPSHADQILALYPCSALDPKSALVQVHTDLTFTCWSRRIARAIAAGQSEPVHRYYFTFTNPTSAALGAYHTAEIPYVFGTYGFGSAQENTLSDALQDYWTRFAATGDPNGTGTTWQGVGSVARQRARARHADPDARRCRHALVSSAARGRGRIPRVLNGRAAGRSLRLGMIRLESTSLAL